MPVLLRICFLVERLIDVFFFFLGEALLISPFAALLILLVFFFADFFFVIAMSLAPRNWYARRVPRTPLGAVKGKPPSIFQIETVGPTRVRWADLSALKQFCPF